MSLPVFSKLVRPVNDNGRGMHLSASVYHNWWFDNADQRRRWRNELDGLGVKWVKLLDDGGGSSLGICEWLWKELGIMPVVRLYRHEPNPGHIGDREVQTIKAIVKACGIPVLFETNNEPDLPCEWKDGKMPTDWWNPVLDNLAVDLRMAANAGGLWLFPAFTHGATLTDPTSHKYNNVLRWFADRPGVAELMMQVGGVAIHNYTKNHPLDYPLDAVNQTGSPVSVQEYESYGDPRWVWDGVSRDQINRWRAEDKNPGDTVFDDWTCFNCWQVWDWWAVEVFGDHLPLITTEGGPVISDKDDRRYPRITPELHIRDTLAIENWFMDEAPAHYLAYCHWLLADAEMGHSDAGHYTSWETQCWYTWCHSQTPGWMFKGQIPTVAAVKNMPTYARKNGGATMPTTPETPNVPENGTNVPDLSTRQWLIPAGLPKVKLVEASVLAGQHYWRLVKAEWLDETTAKGDHSIYIDVLDGEGTTKNDIAILLKNGGTASALSYKDGGKTANFGMYGLLGSYTVQIGAGLSDRVEGLGLGDIQRPGMTIHTVFKLTFQEAVAGGTPPEPPPQPPEPPMSDYQERLAIAKGLVAQAMVLLEEAGKA